MTLARRGDYVIRSAICLAGVYGASAQHAAAVSHEMGVPRTFVSQILGDLVHAGLAVASYGTSGGYFLARPPADITLAEVVAAAEGPMASGGCVLGDGPCHWGSVCPMHETWGAASGVVRAVLDHEPRRSGRT